MRILVLFFTIISFSWGLINVSLSKTLSSFNNDEYNVFLTPPVLTMSKKSRKTKKAIIRGYLRAQAELQRDVYLHNIKFNLKEFSLKSPSQRDRTAAQELLNMLTAELQILETNSNTPKVSLKEEAKTALSADGLDALAPSDDAMDMTQDTNNESQSGESIFISAFQQIGEMYDPDARKKYLADYLFPFNVNGNIEKKKVNSVIGFAFFPTNYGRVKLMKIYIIVVNLNTEEKQKVTIIAKRIPEKGSFVWNRNYLYIAGNTGKVLRQIISDVLGKTF